jgi:hypothetical protein
MIPVLALRPRMRMLESKVCAVAARPLREVAIRRRLESALAIPGPLQGVQLFELARGAG